LIRFIPAEEEPTLPVCVAAHPAGTPHRRRHPCPRRAQVQSGAPHHPDPGDL